MSDKLAKSYPANYDAHARSVANDAYWKQVRRTVNGVPIDERQIALIVDAITTGLSLTRDDVVLDLCCGNGVLSAHLFDKCFGLIGIDISPYLVEVAKKNFARPNYYFYESDVVSYLLNESGITAFNKALLYSGLQYLSRDDAVLAFTALNEGFSSVSKVFIGELPNKQRVDRFYQERVPAEAELNDHEALLGIWYLPEEIEELARATGWRASCSCMPAEFHGSNYRFDVTLERA